MMTDHPINLLIEQKAVLRGSSLVKTYTRGTETVDAVTDVNISINEAEILAILGPSGCGKSSLLQLLSGIEAPDSGEVSFAGQQLASLSESEMAKVRSEHFGFVLQQGNLIPSLTLLENVSLPLLCNGIDARQANQMALPLLERVGVAHRGSAFPTEVSGGEAQRAAIVRACVCGQQIIFADEPTGALDSASASQVRRIFQEIVEDIGSSIVLVTHDPETAKIATRTVVMRDGGIVDEY